MRFMLHRVVRLEVMKSEPSRNHLLLHGHTLTARCQVVLNPLSGIWNWQPSRLQVKRGT